MPSLLKDLTPLLLGGAVIYVVTQSGIMKGLGGIGEGVEEAAGGLGGGIARAGQAAGFSIQDVLGITALLRPVGTLGEAGVSEIERWTASREREGGQQEEIDVLAHEQEKANLAAIQAEQEIKTAQEQAERERLIEEEKTQYVEFATTLPETLTGFFKTAGLAAWEYSPLGLLQSYIQGQSSIEEQAAPQQSAPVSISGGGAPTEAVSGGAPIPSSSSRGIRETTQQFRTRVISTGEKEGTISKADKTYDVYQTPSGDVAVKEVKSKPSIWEAAKSIFRIGRIW